MKTLEELNAIRDRMKSTIALREETNETRIVVGMATCGIAAGARPVLNKFAELVEKAGLTGKVSVTAMGCIGHCTEEPIVEVISGADKVTYGKVTPQMAEESMEKHIQGGKPIAEYLLGDAAN